MIFISIVHSCFGEFNSPTHSTTTIQYCILYLECDRTEIGLLRVIVVKIQEYFPVDKNVTQTRISLNAIRISTLIFLSYRTIMKLQLKLEFIFYIFDLIDSLTLFII